MDCELAYVIRRMFLSPSHGELIQRHQLFRTSGATRNFVLRVIVDNDICKNIRCRVVVSKLKLPIEKHLNPYIIEQIMAA